MNYLLDTHVLLWAVNEPKKLSANVQQLFAAPGQRYWISIASIWETAIKVSLNKLQLGNSFRPWIDQALADMTLTVLPISVRAADCSATLPWHHRDPFDRILIAQAVTENFPLISSDVLLNQYPVKRVW